MDKNNTDKAVVLILPPAHATYLKKVLEEYEGELPPGFVQENTNLYEIKGALYSAMHLSNLIFGD